jgi:dephospho-CoA kinase
VKIIGLTGSIGMGKSTTAQMFADFGVPIFDADAAVHKLYDANLPGGGQAVPLIRAVFPNAVKDGAVIRDVLAGHMRADPINLTVLESFIHPMVAEARAAFLKTHADKPAVLFDVPLLFETGGDKNCDVTIAVTCSSETQAARVLARLGMSEAKFRSLLARQMPDAEKRARADHIISTEISLEDTRMQVKNLLNALGLGHV